MIYVLRQWKAGQISGLCHHLERNALPYRVLEAYDVPSYPSRVSRKDAIFSLGGPPSVCRMHDEDYEHTYLVEEARFIREATRAGAGFFGICLGHQLRARMDFHRVETRHLVFGIEPVELTPEGQGHWLFQGLPRSLRVYQHHQDAVCEIPEHAHLLARSETCGVEAACWGERQVSTQFHPEVLATDIPTVLARQAETLQKTRLTAEEMLARVPASYPMMTRRLFDNFFYRVGLIARPPWIQGLWNVPSLGNRPDRLRSPLRKEPAA